MKSYKLLNKFNKINIWHLFEMLNTKTFIEYKKTMNTNAFSEYKRDLSIIQKKFY